ncbi:hypothetical protein SKAU_G00360120 [Synaphobranchus kaupii]|uniref:Retrotransposon gag domain-containing protein n=1 Tax=Synaphobranchus kaupii TaxID=118154 RepID=A0A9Q1IH10_SYNKA|nr:hypothetical protein SKAU_G00360120 [Synaphobranchus kaupii]
MSSLPPGPVTKLECLSQAPSVIASKKESTQSQKMTEYYGSVSRDSRREGNKRSILRPHPHFLEIATCPVAIEVYGMIPLLLPEGVEIPCGGVETRRGTNPHPLPEGRQICDIVTPFHHTEVDQACHVATASRSRSRADIYRDTMIAEKPHPLSPGVMHMTFMPVREPLGLRESPAHLRATEFHKPRSWGPRHGPRFKHLDSIAKDIEQFDPEKQDHNVEDYLRELERCLSDLPNATRQERVKLIWKTTSRSVRAFIDLQPLIVRESFSQLSRALIEEFSPFANETSATISALQIRHRRSEAPKEFYNRLKHAFFQGRNGPGLTEDRAFKSLFLHNLHSCVRTHITLMTQIENPPMREIRRIAQVAWETIAHTGDKRDEDPKVLATQSSSNVPLEPEDSVVSILKNTAPYASQDHSTRHDSVKGGWKGGQNKPQGGDIHHLTGGEKGDNGYFSHQEKSHE